MYAFVVVARMRHANLVHTLHPGEEILFFVSVDH